jgi:hypothetical protein
MSKVIDILQKKNKVCDFEKNAERDSKANKDIYSI